LIQKGSSVVPIVITTAEEYEAAKQEVQRLESAPESTLEQARLIELVKAIEAWERKSLRAPLAF
jgi:hypothetical protein